MVHVLVSQHRGLGPASSPVLVGSRRHGTGWRLAALAEVTLAAVAVLADLLVPAVLLVLMAWASVVVRHDGFATLGLVRVRGLWRLAGQVLALTVAWTLVQLALVIPAAEHLTGRHQEMGAFDELRGNLVLLLVLVAASWVLGALVEEVAFRGYLRTRLVDLLGPTPVGGVVATAVAAILFGLLHTEQGMVGVIITSVDAVFFTVLARRSASGLWASILAHGFNNTLGLVTFFLIGPVYGLW